MPSIPRADRVTVRFEGPFFTGDPIKKLGSNSAEVMAQIAHWGESRVNGLIQSRHVRYRGRVDSVSPAGHHWTHTAVISPDTRGLSRNEAISVMAAAHELEYGHRRGRKRHDALGRGRGKHAVSRTKAELSRWRKGFGDLFKGLN